MRGTSNGPSGLFMNTSERAIVKSVMRKPGSVISKEWRIVYNAAAEVPRSNRISCRGLRHVQ
jgi:hypothetical protein